MQTKILKAGIASLTEQQQTGNKISFVRFEIGDAVALNFDPDREDVYGKKTYVGYAANMRYTRYSNNGVIIKCFIEHDEPLITIGNVILYTNNGHGFCLSYSENPFYKLETELVNTAAGMKWVLQIYINIPQLTTRFSFDNLIEETASFRLYKHENAINFPFGELHDQATIERYSRTGRAVPLVNVKNTWYGSPFVARLDDTVPGYRISGGTVGDNYIYGPTILTTGLKNTYFFVVGSNTTVEYKRTAALLTIGFELIGSDLNTELGKNAFIDRGNITVLLNDVLVDKLYQIDALTGQLTLNTQTALLTYQERDTFIISGTNSSPYLYAYSYPSLVVTDAVDVYPAGRVYSMSFSVDTGKLAVSHNSTAAGSTYNGLILSIYDVGIDYEDNSCTIVLDETPIIGTESQGQLVRWQPGSSNILVRGNTSAKMYNSVSWTTISNLDGGGAIIDANFKQDGSQLAIGLLSSGYNSSYVYIYNTATWTRQTLTLGTRAVKTVSYSPDGSKLAIIYGTNPPTGQAFFSVYNTSTWSLLSIPNVTPCYQVRGLAWAKDSSYFVVAYKETSSATLSKLAVYMVDESTITLDRIITTTGLLLPEFGLLSKNETCYIAASIYGSDNYITRTDLFTGETTTVISGGAFFGGLSLLD